MNKLKVIINFCILGGAITGIILSLLALSYTVSYKSAVDIISACVLLVTVYISLFGIPSP